MSSKGCAVTGNRTKRGCVREKGRERGTDRERKQKERELAHVIREAKSQDKSLGSSKPRNTVSFQKPKALDLTKACCV